MQSQYSLTHWFTFISAWAVLFALAGINEQAHQEAIERISSNIKAKGAIVNCCVLNSDLSGSFLHDSIDEGPSFDDVENHLVRA